MIDFVSAFKTVMDNLPDYGKTETVPLIGAFGRILAEDIKTDRDIPPFNRVAMDGYACRKDDIDKELTVIEVVPAGKAAEKKIGNGECSKVMTGCPLPEGAEMVFMVEISKELPANKVKCFDPQKALKSENFAKTGEDIKKGAIVIPEGTFVTIKHIPIIAACGYGELQIMKKPMVGIISTGDELVEPYETPLPHQIRNSNSWQLSQQVKKVGALPKYYGIIKDDEAKITEIIALAQLECDIILISGGVSEGDFDFVPKALKNCGFDIIFDKVAVKPGKPTTFAVNKDTDKVCFGLPGNPVSTFVVFEFIVRPFILLMLGSEYLPQKIKAEMATKFERKKTERTEFVPVKINDACKVEVVKYHGSGHFTALVDTDGFIMIEKGVNKIDAKETVEVLII
jgi:molybdopterin molybdotransferase